MPRKGRERPAAPAGSHDSGGGKARKGGQGKGKGSRGFLAPVPRKLPYPWICARRGLSRLSDE
ncbi:hypothetical protein GCM10017653_38100 [Ancylobacter defluvii]|uniref:Uncharacterized protein n=1 Tax=Ancylobacter defluvii TaxID=1282440 RepID=A0A9W6JXK8_9HYPH|nr:hypothetical protein GCM10017653_38100 [Ancylobacter defluvii]